MRTIKFSKMVATGNDFIVVDNRRSSLAASPAAGSPSRRLAKRCPDLFVGTGNGGRSQAWSDLSVRPLAAHHPSYIAKKLCDRKLGIGADGLLLLESSRAADFKMRIFNPDGSEPKMCGNGSRCIALYAKSRKIAPSADITIETRAGILSAKVKNRLIKINMTEPKGMRLGMDIEIEKEVYRLHCINTGVPHAVYFVKALDGVDVFRIGRGIRYHQAFRPSGTNVDFVQTKDKSSLLMRSYERGVEAETLACGTGAVASAIISAILKGFNSPVKAYTRGGLLIVHFKKNKDRFSRVFLEGEAREVFEGELKISV